MKWYKWISRQGVDLTTIEYIDRAFFDLINKYTRSLKECFFTTLENKFFTHYTRVDLDKVGMYLYKKYWSKPEQLKKYYGQSLKDKKRNELAARNWRKKLLGSQNVKALVGALKNFKINFIKFNYRYSIAPFLPVEAWQKDFEKTVSPLLVRLSASEKELILDSLTKPWKETYLVGLKDKTGKWSQKNILQQSQFLRSWSIIWYQPLDQGWARDLKPDKAVGAKRQKLLSTGELIKRLRPNREQEKFIKIAPYLAFYKDWRDELRRRQVYSWSFLFDKIALALNVPREQLGYLTLSEINKSLRLGVIDKRLINKRAKNLILVTSRPSSLRPLVVDENNKIDKYLKIIQSLKPAEKSGVVKGLTAYPGKAIGRVRVIKTARDLIKFRNGEVFLANTTHPNYLAAMRKAAAIVTNEGGIMSHAAITAREFKISCVVGAGNATKIFQDGDAVEVDADEGIVRLRHKQ